MKLTIQNSVLQSGLAHARRIVERRSTIPILANVLLTAKDNSLHLRTTDLDLETSLRLPAEIDKAGGCSVAAEMLFGIVSKMPQGAQTMLEIDGESKQLHIRAGRSRFKLHTLPVDDFPQIEVKETNQTFHVGAPALNKLFGKTQFAICAEEARYYLNGVYLHVANGADKKTLRGVATDGHRLAMVDQDLPEGAEGMSGMIVPRKTVAEILKLIDKADAESKILVACSPGKIVFETGDIKLVSKLIDGTFPDYPRVLPVGNDKVLTVNREEMLCAVDRVTTVSSERGRAVKLDFAHGKLTMSVNNPDTGDSHEEIEVEYGSDPLQIGFNSRYLLDILSTIEGENVEIKLADPGSPTIFASRGDLSSLYVLMPMRV